MSTSPSEMMDDINLNGDTNGGNSSSDDEVVVGEDEELADSDNPANGTSSSTNIKNELNGNTSINAGELDPQNEKPGASGDVGFFRFEALANDDLFGDRPIPEWVGWGESADFPVGGSSVNPFEDYSNSSADLANPVEVAPTPISSTSGGVSLPNGASTSTNSSDDGSLGSDSSKRAAAVPSLFEEDVEFVGVELEGTEKAMDQALKEGIVGEAGPLKRNIVPKMPENENSDDSGTGMKEFNDANYWRVDQEVAVLE